MRPAGWRVGPAWRLSIGLASIVAVVLLVLDVALGPVSGTSDATRRMRQAYSEALAAQVAAQVRVRNAAGLDRVLGEIAARDPQIESIGLRLADGRLLAHTPAHVSRWRAGAATSALRDIQVPLRVDDQDWAMVEVAFAPSTAATGVAWREHPFALSAGAVGALCLVLFYLYLRRSFAELQPAPAAPDRVRQAFDTLPGAVAVLDLDGRVLMVNRAFARLHPLAERDATGQPLSTLPWLAVALTGDRASHPWSRRPGANPGVGELVRIPQPDGTLREVIVKCARIYDTDGEARGCLVTCDDVSELRAANALLNRALSHLQTAQAQMAQQNRLLRRLATHDALTDCLNRRALFEDGAALLAYAAEQGRALSCVAVDVDHLRRLNACHGHALGDAALISTARLLAEGLPPGSLFGRCGVSFCLVLPDVPVRDAWTLAERLRAAVEQRVQTALKGVDLPVVTCSFGIASPLPGERDFAMLVARADQALAEAKRAGRNRVESVRADEPDGLARDAA